MSRLDLPTLVQTLAAVPPDRFWPVVGAVVLVLLAVTLPCAVVAVSRRRGGTRVINPAKRFRP